MSLIFKFDCGLEQHSIIQHHHTLSAHPPTCEYPILPVGEKDTQQPLCYHRSVNPLSIAPLPPSAASGPSSSEPCIDRFQLSSARQKCQWLDGQARPRVCEQ